MKLSDKTLKIIIAVAVVVLGVSFIFGGYVWFEKKQRRVLAGTARPTFPYSDYSIDELNKLFPQYLNEDVATTQSPEETYGKLKKALLENNIGSALDTFYFRNKDKYSEVFNKKYNDGKLSSLASNLDDVIIMGSDCDNTRCIYTMENSKAEISFIKNSQGVWLIESL